MHGEGGVVVLRQAVPAAAGKLVRAWAAVPAARPVHHTPHTPHAVLPFPTPSNGPQHSTRIETQPGAPTHANAAPAAPTIQA